MTDLSAYSEDPCYEPEDKSVNRFLKHASTIAKRVFNQTGGHPFLIQYLMHCLCEDDLETTGSRLNGGVRRFLDEQRTLFQSWWFDKFQTAERQVYAHLVSQNRTVPRRDVVNLVGDTAANEALSVLMHTGVVAKLGSQEKYRAAGLMFKKWFMEFGVFPTDSVEYDAILEGKLRKVDEQLAGRYVSAWKILKSELQDYSGAVSPIRDVLTHVLRTLAPDKAVMSEPGYVPEKGQDSKPLPTPTRKQRTHFIMKQQGKKKEGAKALEKHIELFDTLTEQLARSVDDVYDHASGRTHVGATYEQAWRCLKQLDSILAQLFI